jgi:hypothetical protein
MVQSTKGGPTMKKLGLALAVMMASSVLIAGPSLARTWGDDAAPSLKEFDDSAHGG